MAGPKPKPGAVKKLAEKIRDLLRSDVGSLGRGKTQLSPPFTGAPDLDAREIVTFARYTEPPVLQPWFKPVSHSQIVPPPDASQIPVNIGDLSLLLDVADQALTPHVVRQPPTYWHQTTKHAELIAAREHAEKAHRNARALVDAYVGEQRGLNKAIWEIYDTPKYAELKKEAQRKWDEYQRQWARYSAAQEQFADWRKGLIPETTVSFERLPDANQISRDQLERMSYSQYVDALRSHTYKDDMIDALESHLAELPPDEQNRFFRMARDKLEDDKLTRKAKIEAEQELDFFLAQSQDPEVWERALRGEGPFMASAFVPDALGRALRPLQVAQSSSYPEMRSAPQVPGRRQTEPRQEGEGWARFAEGSPIQAALAGAAEAGVGYGVPALNALVFGLPYYGAKALGRSDWAENIQSAVRASPLTKLAESIRAQADAARGRMSPQARAAQFLGSFAVPY